MPFRPLQNRILVKRDEAIKQTASGIILTQQSQQAPPVGTVIASGPTSTIEVGARVMFGRYSGTEINVDGETALILRDDEVLGIV